MVYNTYTIGHVEARFLLVCFSCAAIDLQLDFSREGEDIAV